MSQPQLGGHIQPRFPPELEREIFERAAGTYPGTAATLAIVSRRVQIWMETVIYNTVTLSTETVCARFLRTIETRPPAFFAENVKSLCIPGDIDPMLARRILIVCQGVINLAYWIIIDPPPFSVITSLRPKRLSINMRSLFGHREKSPDFGHPFFSNVTHLEIVDWPWMTASSGFERLPCLTHLAVDLDHYDDSIIKRLRDILLSCQTLLVLLCLVPSDNIMVKASNAFACLDDVRLVVLSDSESDVFVNWEASLVEGSDACQWYFAEAIVSEKQGLLRYIDAP